MLNRHWRCYWAATIMCHALLYSFACHVCVAAPCSLVRYLALQYVAAGCAYAAAHNEIAWYVTLTHAAVGWARWAWTAALDQWTGSLGLIHAAAGLTCAAAPEGIKWHVALL